MPPEPDGEEEGAHGVYGLVEGGVGEGQDSNGAFYLWVIGSLWF